MIQFLSFEVVLEELNASSHRTVPAKQEVNMDFEANVARIDQIKSQLKAVEGQTVHVRASLGRSRFIERDGVVTAVHPALFIVETKERRGRIARMSYQYVDVLIGVVEITDAKTGEYIASCAQFGLQPELGSSAGDGDVTGDGDDVDPEDL